MSAVERRQINVYVPQGFLTLIDETASLTSSTRSDFVRRALEYYIIELKKSQIFSSLEKSKSERERGLTRGVGRI